MYGWEKFYLASKGLSESQSPQRQALEDAYVFHIIHVQEHDVPADLWPVVESITEAVTLPDEVDPIGGHSGCNFAISNLSDEEVESTIAKIHSVYESLDQLYKSGELDDSA